MKTLIVIPTLNEAAHIRDVIATVAPFAGTSDARVVVADGGSTDGTRAIVADLAEGHAWLHLLDNPDRLQSGGINRAVAAHGDGCDWLIRLDAHATYPPDFIPTLIAQAQDTGADSVVVAMIAQGRGPLQTIIAMAQNSRFGNGGSAHRNASDGAWVGHGHHALFRLSAFRSVGGYDPAFSHNEDAELDVRLTAAGYRIWLTGRTHLIYVPRATLSGLFRQYRNFGRGRAATLAKHGLRPARRQAIVIALLPALCCAVLAPVTPLALLPLAVWCLGCVAAGVMIAWQERTPLAVAAGPVAGLMQLSWSLGYWRQRLSRRGARQAARDMTRPAP